MPARLTKPRRTDRVPDVAYPGIDALAVYRLTRLVTSDAIFDGPRSRFIAWANSRREPTTWVCASCGDERSPLVGPCPSCRSTELQQRGNAPTDPPSKLAYLATCPWCLSIWIGAGAVIARRYCPRGWDPLARALALSAIAGIADQRVG